MNRLLRGLAAVTAVSALAFSACGGSEGATAPPTSTQPKPPEAATTTEADPVSAPITPAEERWRGQVESYSERLEQGFGQGGAITHGSMRREARLYLECARTLERAGDPGRFEPALRFAERGCERLAKASEFLEQAIASSERGGFVYAGTPEEKRFDRALRGAAETAGNGLYELQRALGQMDQIERSFGR